MTTILIAEDDTDVLTMLCRVFTRAGFTVLDAADGDVALDLARRWTPDVVLSDLEMPHLDGRQLCRAMRRDPVLRDVPVALLSGGLGSGDPDVAGEDVCGVWLKPFDNAELVAAMRKLADAGHGRKVSRGTA
ncbi:response regulator [Nucisporomicrobium flavum]|jgi:CheY-like chemotaxis protein|uniref:response regulator n=1 Tax=Nucisporomicrobium flavum TaxID=2785915 RepID=UPI0018F5659B|nr:response regulator [Nucisporomicrobium flavum]